MKRLTLTMALTFAMLSANAQDDFNYDVNNDGDVNVTDVMMVVKKIFGNNSESTPEYRPIILKVSERPLTHPTSSKAGLHRAPAFTTSSLKSFYLNIMYKHDMTNRWNCSDVSETKKTANGTYENQGSWPTYGSTDAHVFAYKTTNDAPFKYNDGNPYLQISTEESSSDQCDVLVARTDANWGECEGVVSLTFAHACAALQFSVMKTASLAAYDVEVNEIVLHNVKGDGKYLLLNDEWTDVSTPKYFTLSAYQSGTPNAVTVTETETLLAKDADDYLFLIPQNISGMNKGTAISEADQNNEAYLEIKCKIYDPSTQHYLLGGLDSYGKAYLPFSADLSNGAGHVHPFVISIGTAIRDASGNKFFN